jgi:hypothetical protein
MQLPAYSDEMVKEECGACLACAACAACALCGPTPAEITGWAATDMLLTLLYLA